MASRLFGATPLSEHILLVYCKSDHKEHVLVKFCLNIQGNALKNVVCEMTAILYRLSMLMTKCFERQDKSYILDNLIHISVFPVVIYIQHCWGPSH